ncbi:putative signal transduction protein containing a GGDEF domain [Acetobacterium woodii DSM 1030]|uniref:Stage 0 sporulation protein A homolog n=2 Tax=Acetobacterium woodii TaxID=33952 RepID=H6LJ87_ACEWD|nr:putative signal transduction protein containing a GGDEF domain [Acetobacterium woodii DSM 1030]
MMNNNEQSKLAVLNQIKNQLNQALQDLVVLSIEPKSSRRQLMLAFFAEIKGLALQYNFRELGYLCMKNEEFLKQTDINLAVDHTAFIKLAQRFGELTLCVENLLAVATRQEGSLENLVCNPHTREVIKLTDHNYEISSQVLGRVLVLDDEMLVLNIIESVLRNRGYDVRITNNSSQAMEILRAHEVDILILDLIMPDKSGIEFYRELKQNKIVIPTIILTASTNKEDHILALQEGIDDFLRKPFEADVLVANVEKLIKKEKKHKNAYMRDPLTSAYSRCYFAERFAQEKAKFQRDGIVFSVVFIDLDHFKEINDTYGHLFGDIVLKSFVDEFKKSLRPYDQISRYGGDEFLLLLPETDAVEAYRVVERIRQKFQRKAFNTPVNLRRIYVTFSAGITEYNSSDKTLEDVLENADCQLYRAKERGRACTSFLTDTIDTGTEKYRILICDDSSTVSQLIDSRLSRLGLETQVVATGKEALTIFPDFHPHLLILDIILPDISGEIVLKKIREIETENQVKVILISVKSLGEKKPLLNELSYDDFIKKPISLEQLEQSVKRLL